MLIDQIKAALLAARKVRDAKAAASLSTLVGECETLAKAGRGDLSDAVVVTIVKKFVKNINDTVALLPVDNDSTDESFDQLLKEKALYESFLPTQLSEEELSEVIDGFIVFGAKDIGECMRRLKVEYAGSYDGATASRLLKAKFS